MFRYLTTPNANIITHQLHFGQTLPQHIQFPTDFLITNITDTYKKMRFTLQEKTQTNLFSYPKTPYRYF